MPLDWHVMEVGLVTTLSVWIWLFSPSPVSRWVAAAVFAFNLLYVIVERERPAAGPAPAPTPAPAPAAPPVEPGPPPSHRAL